MRGLLLCSLCTIGVSYPVYDGSVHPAYNLYFSACFFSRNSVLYCVVLDLSVVYDIS
jgi:hypothetical protein